MNKTEIATKLVQLAAANRSRGDFNRAVKSAFRQIGKGCFRFVFSAGDYVIKIRRCRPDRDQNFKQWQIDASNREEAANYQFYTQEHKLLSNLILEPILVNLPNGHDAIIMEKVKVWGDLNMYQQERVEETQPALHNQIQAIQMAFRDGHDYNIGFKNGRAFLIDVNFDSEPRTLDNEEMEFIVTALHGAGVYCDEAVAELACG